jgi:UDP:flavonoid glycosyltransferase YjiC (YdhE family)
MWRAGGPLADLALRGPINRGRTTLGLDAQNDPISRLLLGRTILAADRDLAPPSADAPKCAVNTDAWPLDQPGALEARVEAFLQESATRPIYVGFGSMVAPRAAELVTQTIAAVRAAGRRVVIAGGWAALETHTKEADDVITVDNVPHSLIFPRVAAAVHHGGAGTTTAAARAGIPQVLLPHILDQYYWAHRVRVLGLGPPALPVERVTVEVLSNRISRAVDDPLIRERVDRLAPLVAARNGLATAVQEIEALRSSGFGSGRDGGEKPW